MQSLHSVPELSPLSSSSSGPVVLVLGCGYVGSAVARRLAGEPSSASRVVVTHRVLPCLPSSSPFKQPPIELRVFDLEDASTWSVPWHEIDFVLWTFPVAQSLVQQQKAMAFSKEIPLTVPVLMLGTTSSYQCKGEAGSVYGDNTPLEPLDVRAQTEQLLLGPSRAVVRLSGIFGPGREPLRWLQRGLISSGQKFVNLIHVEDIVDCIFFFLHQFVQMDLGNKSYLLTNNNPMRWNDIVDEFKNKELLPQDFVLPQLPEGSESKRLFASQLFESKVFSSGFRLLF